MCSARNGLIITIKSSFTARLHPRNRGVILSVIRKPTRALVGASPGSFPTSCDELPHRVLLGFIINSRPERHHRLAALVTVFFLLPSVSLLLLLLILFSSFRPPVDWNMASGCAVRVLPCALVLFVLLSWLKHDLSTTPKEDSATPSPDTSSFLTPSEGPYVQPTAESVRFEDPPSPCNDVAEIVEGAEKSSHLHLQTVPSANLHVFSAFIDTRLSQEAVIIGATLHPDPELFADLMCLFVDGFNVWRSTASVHIESEYPGLSTK